MNQDQKRVKKLFPYFLQSKEPVSQAHSCSLSKLIKTAWKYWLTWYSKKIPLENPIPIFTQQIIEHVLDTAYLSAL